jgi:light-regulated signal transduction histidine kinase (bacteriophytochrome)
VDDVDSNAVLDKALFTLRPAILNCCALITRGPLPKVRLQEFRLEQLFHNLISNALRYRKGIHPENQDIRGTGRQWLAICNSGRRDRRRSTLRGANF